jgi:hypothetical protein
MNDQRSHNVEQRTKNNNIKQGKTKGVTTSNKEQQEEQQHQARGNEKSSSIKQKTTKGATTLSKEH